MVRSRPRRRAGSPHGRLAGREQRRRELAVAQLVRAAASGDPQKLARVLCVAQNIDAGDYDARTALHLAASSGSLACTRQLLAAGASVNVRDRWGRTPQDDAKHYSHRAIELELIASPAKKAGGVASVREAGGAKGSADPATPLLDTLSSVRVEPVRPQASAPHRARK